MANRARSAAPGCNASSMPRTKRTTVRAVKRTARCWPTARCRGYLRMIGREPSRNGRRAVAPGDRANDAGTGRKVLGVFAKYPEPGRVKTRLAAATSPAWAAQVAEALLLDCLA